MQLTEDEKKYRDKAFEKSLKAISFRQDTITYYTRRCADRSLTQQQREYAEAFLAGANGRPLSFFGSWRNSRRAAHLRGQRYARQRTEHGLTNSS